MTSTTNHPPSAGWFWWRQNKYDTWKVVEVRFDALELYSSACDDMEYQCTDDPKSPFQGEWWPVRIEPPPC